jgi:site-specific recombinase XerD
MNELGQKSKFDPVESWIVNVAYSHSQNKNTPYSYKRSLEKFCAFIGKSAAEILAEYETIDERDFKRSYARYIKAFIGELTNQGYVSSSINVAVAAIRSFFKYSDLTLGFVPTGSKRITYHNREIQKEEILAVLSASKPREKAFYIMMAQTGLRPDTLVKLKLEDIEPDFSKGVVPCQVRVKETQTKGAYSEYYSFMGEDSINALKAYFSTLRGMNNLNIKKDKRSNMSAESLLFTYQGSEIKAANPKSFSAMFSKTLRQLMASNTITYKQGAYNKPSDLRLYTLRKYFRNNGSKAGPAHINYWMGHLSALGVDIHYFGQDVEKHREQYRKFAMPDLRLQSSTPNENEKLMIEKSKEVDELKNKVVELTQTVNTLKDTLTTQWNYINQHSAIAAPEQNAEIEEEVKLKTLMKAKGISAKDLLEAISSISEKKSQ